MDTDTDTTDGAITGGLSMLILLVGLGGLALGIPWAWVAFPVGYGGVLPLTLGLLRARSADDGTDEPTDPIATLRERYASGEIDEAAFERRVERLLETES